MMARTRNLRERLLGSSRPVESLVRNVLFLGFLFLLLLVAGVGYRSFKSLEQLEKESVLIDDVGEQHLRLVLDLSKIAGKVVPEARTLVTKESNFLDRIPAQMKLKDLKKEMDAKVERIRLSSLIESREWQQFESAYREFWTSMDESTQGSNKWHDARDQMLQALDDLDLLVDKEREDNDGRAHEMSARARTRIVAATGVVLLVGVVVAALALYEINRNLKSLAGAYAASAESRDYLQSLLDSLVSGVVVIRQDGIVQTVSESFRSLPDVGAESATGQHYEELFRDNPSLKAAVSDGLSQRATKSRHYGRVDLGPGLFDVFASPLIVGGEQHGIILVFVDISEAARAKAELRRNYALTAVGQMTAQIAHEIKNPLGSIRFAAEFLKRKTASDLPADALSTIQVIERSVDHLAAIVTELSEFARPKKLNRSQIDVNDLLENLLPMVADRLSAKQIEVIKSFGPGFMSGYYDGTELKKLFLNLIINAIEASDPTTSIELRTRSIGDHEIVVEVADQGCGMDAETQRRLFEAFYTTKEKGTGLGMAIAKQIAELHGGDLSVMSRSGVGSTATVKLPMTKFAEADNKTGAANRLSR